MAPNWALLPLIGAGHRGHGDRVAGADHGRLLGHQAGDAAGLPAAPAHPAHLACATPGRSTCPSSTGGCTCFIVLAVVMFKTSAATLASAYGIAVTHGHDDHHGDDLLRHPLRLEATRWPLCVAATGFFFVVDFTFFASNLLKLFDGGWFPLLIGIGMFMLMMTWKQGRRLMGAAPARRRHRPERLPRMRCSSARRCGCRHGRVPGAEAGPDAERADAQPEAQQGAARAQPVRHRAAPRGALDRLRQARRRSSRWATTAGR